MQTSDARKRNAGKGQMKYRKKPVEVMAWDVNTLLMVAETNREDVFPEAIRSGLEEGVLDFCKDHISIVTLEGVMVARPGDMLICGVRGEMYPCKGDIFDQTYEPA